MSTSTYLLAISAALSTVLAQPAFGLDLTETLQLHGYGDLAQSRSNVDPSGAGRGASKTTYNTSLVGTWQASEQTSIWTQIHQSDEPNRLRIDWAYVDHRGANGMRWRAGQVRLPFGLHNESRDVQALRPGATLPVLYADDLGVVDESFYGGSVESQLQLGSSTLSYEVYGAGALLPGGDRTAYGPAIGGRAIFEPPVAGLSLGLSSYAARLKPAPGEQRQQKRATAFSLRWQHNPIELQAEWARGVRYGRGIETSYVQGAWQFARQWELMSRIERVITDTAQSEDDAFRERRFVLGLAGRINHHVGLRLEQRWHRGNGMSVAQEVIEPGEGRARWASTVFSVNYQF